MVANDKNWSVHSLEALSCPLNSPVPFDFARCLSQLLGDAGDSGVYERFLRATQRKARGAPGQTSARQLVNTRSPPRRITIGNHTIFGGLGGRLKLRVLEVEDCAAVLTSIVGFARPKRALFLLF